MLPLSPEAEKYIFSNGVMPNKQASMMDFLLQSCEQPFTTPNINRAIIHYRQVPTEPRIRYLLAKADARAVQPYLGHGFRDFLHSAYTQLGEGTELGSVLEAIVDYQQGGKGVVLENTLRQPKVVGFFATEEKRRQLFDRDAYNAEIDDPVAQKKLPVSSLLERIKAYVDYMPSVYKTAPYTPDDKLNEKLGDMAVKGVSTETIDSVLMAMNESLQTKIQAEAFGIDSGMINAMEWLDMKMGGFIYHLPYERQGLAFRERWFENVLKYQELTGTAHDFDAADFERRIVKMKSLSAKDASDFVREMTLDRQAKLRAMYGEADYLHDIFVYVAGLVDVGLMIPLTARRAETVQGERSKAYHADSVFKGIVRMRNEGD